MAENDKQIAQNVREGVKKTFKETSSENDYGQKMKSFFGMADPEKEARERRRGLAEKMAK